MNKKWLYIKTTIALALIIWGFFRLYENIEHAYNYADIANNSSGLFGFTASDIYVQLQAQLLISLLTLIGGILLMMSKKLGWHFAMSTCIVHFIILINASYSPTSTKNLGDFLLGTIFIIPFALILIALMQKPMKENITVKDWLICFALVAIVSADFLIVDN